VEKLVLGRWVALVGWWVGGCVCADVCGCVRMCADVC
jgi:hypothetical protein